MNITKGKVAAPVRGLLYGPEGIGKTTFAAKWPNPLFIDIEDGSSQYDVARTDRPSSWNMLMAIVSELTKDAHGYKTLVIDSSDWAEKLCIAHVCAKKGVESLGGQNDYGHGYNLLATEWGRLLDTLTQMQRSNGMNILFLCHAATRKFELPEEAGSFDKWELKMEKKTLSLTKEWADLMVFANYETLVVDIGGKKKAQGAKRVMFTEHHACWDAKNRFGLPEKMDFDFAGISKIFSSPAPAPAHKPVQQQKPATVPKPVPVTPETVVADVPPDLVPIAAVTDPAIPQALADLMAMDGITLPQVQAAVEKRGYYPKGTPFANYDKNFIEKSLIPGWNRVKEIINNLNKENAA